MTTNYNLKNIRILFTRGFTDEELRRLCYDIPHFRPVYDQLAQNSSKAEIVDLLIKYADRVLQIELLLDLAKEHNPARYEKHQPYHDATLGPTLSTAIQPQVKSQIAKNPMPLTPETFIYTRRPVPPSHFVGRKREVGDILGRLANSARGSSAISGDAQVGKTSLLHYLAEHEVREEWGLAPNWCHFLYLDCYSIFPFSEANFWRHTLDELAPHLRDNEALSGRVQHLLAQANPDSSELNSLFDNIARAGRLVVLLLDEFDWVVENLDRKTPALLNYLRSLLNRPERGLTLVVASLTPLKQLCSGLRFSGSSFDNTFSSVTLYPFSEGEVDELLLSYQVDFSSIERAYLSEVAGTHPYLVQLVASLIVRNRAKIPPFTQVEADIEHETEGYFADIVNYAGERAKMLLVLLALTPLTQYLPGNKATPDDWAKVFRRYEHDELAQLVKRGLVVRRTDGLQLFSPIFTWWVLRQIVATRGQEALSAWEPHYANLLSHTQKEALEDLIDKVMTRPDVIKTPDLLTELFTQKEVSPLSSPPREQVLGRYIIEKLIGEGGMADVFRAHDPGLNRLVAIKKMRAALSTSEEFRARFQREAQAVARLRHPNIVQIHDFGIHDNHYYMVMEFIEGHNLRDYLNQLQIAGRPLSGSEIVQIAIQVAEALDYAHQHQMIHRDVKPANILLTDDGRVFLTDFGMVRLLGQTELTQSGGFGGTLAYMAPEQMDKSEEINHRADIYALGCVVYEMITGRLPIDPTTPPLAYFNTEPLSPSVIIPNFSKFASQVILRALAKNPAERPASVLQFIQDLRQTLNL